jgi:hypothetical protein
MRTPQLKQTPSDTTAHASASLVLQKLLDAVPADHFTLEWLIGSLPRRSFGVAMLLLALTAMVPIGSIVPGLLIAILALQMISNRHGPAFPHCIAVRRLPTAQFVRLGRHAIPVLRYLEKVIRPRWPTPFKARKRVVGIVVLLLTSVLLVAPLPLSNVPPALVIALISLAYIEEDGVLLSIAILAAVILLTIAAIAVWGAVISTVWIGRLD